MVEVEEEEVQIPCDFAAVAEGEVQGCMEALSPSWSDWTDIFVPECTLRALEASPPPDKEGYGTHSVVRRPDPLSKLLVFVNLMELVLLNQ